LTAAATVGWRDLTRDAADAFLRHHDAIGRGLPAARSRLGTARKDIERTPALQAGGNAWLPVWNLIWADLRQPAVRAHRSGFQSKVLEGELNTVLTLRHSGSCVCRNRLLLILAPPTQTGPDAFAQPHGRSELSRAAMGCLRAIPTASTQSDDRR